MNDFRKPAQTVDQHLETLRERGLEIPDEARARHYLANISYFRLSAYTRPYYRPDLDEHRFLAGTNFEDVLDLYVFDRELRLLLLDAIERIEVALRAQLANTLAEHHGAHGYLDPSVFDTRYSHSWLLAQLERAGQGREVETFLAHYRAIYTNAPQQPPIWMAVELLTFKEVSTLFANLRQPGDTQRIEQHFGWKFPVLKSWFRAMSDLRNTCAHHGRVWNREFGSRPETPRRIRRPWPRMPHRIDAGAAAHPEQQVDPRRRLYMFLATIEALMQVVAPSSRWSQRLVALLERHPAPSRPHMGFPADWSTDPFWRRATGGAGAMESE